MASIRAAGFDRVAPVALARPARDLEPKDLVALGSAALPAKPATTAAAPPAPAAAPPAPAPAAAPSGTVLDDLGVPGARRILAHQPRLSLEPALLPDGRAGLKLELPGNRDVHLTPRQRRIEVDGRAARVQDRRGLSVKFDDGERIRRDAAGAVHWSCEDNGRRVTRHFNPETGQDRLVVSRTFTDLKREATRAAGTAVQVEGGGLTVHFAPGIQGDVQEMAHRVGACWKELPAQARDLIGKVYVVDDLGGTADLRGGGPAVQTQGLASTRSQDNGIVLRADLVERGDVRGVMFHESGHVLDKVRGALADDPEARNLFGKGGSEDDFSTPSAFRSADPREDFAEAHRLVLEFLSDHQGASPEQLAGAFMDRLEGLSPLKSAKLQHVFGLYASEEKADGVDEPDDAEVLPWDGHDNLCHSCWGQDGGCPQCGFTGRVEPHIC